MKATVSERTEKESPGTVEASTEPAEPIETKDSGTQHSPAHVDDRFTDYSYLFQLATSHGRERLVYIVLYCCYL